MQAFTKTRHFETKNAKLFWEVGRPIPDPRLLMANQCTKFEVSSLSRSRDILGGLKF